MSLFPIDATVDHRPFRGGAAAADDPAPDPRDRRGGPAGGAGHSRHHRQSGFHPSGGASGARQRRPAIPIVDYVSPTVWAWRPGRARAMRAYVDHVLALLPFEPEVYRRLRGPPCSYVGHPLTEQIDTLRPTPERATRAMPQPPVLLVLPGSRRSEIGYQMAVFGETLGLLQAEHAPVELVLPTMPHLHEAVERGGAGLAGAAADRGRRRGASKAAFRDRARGLRQIRHGDAGTGAGRRADGRGLYGRRGRGLDRPAGDPLVLGDPGQSRAGRERGAGIPAAGLHAGETRVGALRDVLGDTPVRREQLEAFAPARRHHVDRRSIRPARAPPTSCWRRC